MAFDLSKIKNFDDVWENIEHLTDEDLKKLREMGVYEPINVEEPEIDEYITDEDIESGFEKNPKTDD